MRAGALLLASRLPIAPEALRAATDEASLWAALGPHWTLIDFARELARKRRALASAIVAPWPTGAGRLEMRVLVEHRAIGPIVRAWTSTGGPSELTDRGILPDEEYADRVRILDDDE